MLRPAWSDQTEWMDLPGHDPAVLADNLKDLRRVNRWLGGSLLTVRALDQFVRKRSLQRELTIVDIGTGGADIPRAILTWAKRRQLPVRVLATDINAEILSLGQRGASGVLEFALADGRCLPFEDGAFDIATSSLTLHHLPPDEAIALLAEMRRVARGGVIVNDIVRRWHVYVGAWLLSRLFSRNPLTRHDGPLSVKRAYTLDEMTSLAARAGLGDVSFAGFLGYRVAMVSFWE